MQLVPVDCKSSREHDLTKNISQCETSRHLIHTCTSLSCSLVSTSRSRCAVLRLGSRNGDHLGLRGEVWLCVTCSARLLLLAFASSESEYSI